MDVIGEYTDVYNRYAHVKVSFTNEPISFQLMSPDSFNIELNTNDLEKNWCAIYTVLQATNRL